MVTDCQLVTGTLSSLWAVLYCTTELTDPRVKCCNAPVVTLKGRASINQSRPGGRHCPVCALGIISLYRPHNGVRSQSLRCPPFHTPGTAWKFGETTLVYRINNRWNRRRFKTEGEVKCKLWGKFKKDEIWRTALTAPFPSLSPPFSSSSFFPSFSVGDRTQRASTLSGEVPHPTLRKYTFSLRDNGLES